MANGKGTTSQQALPTQAKPQAAPNGQAEPRKIALATNAKTLKGFLEGENVMRELAAAARNFMKPEDLVRITTMAMSRTPLLARCTLSSILRSLMDAAALRVRPGGLNGRGYLIPRKHNKVTPAVYECHFDPGWRGLVDVARRSGAIKSLGAEAVREGDEFDYGYSPLPKLYWKPMPLGPDAGPRAIIAAFAVAQLTDGSIQIEVVDKEDLDKIQAVSAAESGPWLDWPKEQSRKSSVKRLCKYLPVPDDFLDLDKAMALSDGADIGERIIDVGGEEAPEDAPSQEETIAAQLSEPGMSAEDQIAALENEAAQAGIHISS